MKEANSQRSLEQRYFGFPEGLSYPDFLKLKERLRRKIVGNNMILQTDTYNRTMEHVQGKEWSTPETYVMQLRAAKEGYLITYGIREQLENFASLRITQDQLNFAKEFYKNSNVKFFNEEKWQKIIDNGGKLPIAIDSVPDGTAILPGDPVMRVSGPGELAAHFEPYLHRIFYSTRVATIAHEIEEKIGANRFIEVGKRGVPTEETHLMAASAMYAGGGIKLTSNDSAAACYVQIKETGTIGHRFLQAFKKEEQAFRAGIEKLESVSLLVDLNNSIDGIELAIKLKKEFRKTGKKIWIRLDSGDVSSQTIYALRRFREEGFIDQNLDKIIVEGIENVDEMVNIDKLAHESGFDPKAFVLYGAGELLVYKDTGRSFASTGFKLSKRADMETMKNSDSPGKISLPGIPTIAYQNRQRFIAQVGEFASENDLFVPAFVDNKIVLKEDLEKTREIVKTSYARISNEAKNKSRTALSPLTQRKIREYQEALKS